MCGIVGYIGKRSATDIVLTGLEALEYRGYDSAGVAYIAGGHVENLRQVGPVAGLGRLLDEAAPQGATLAVGHTRWATHGAPSVSNAHPHSNTAGTIFVVHNGIIENYASLRARLEAKGYDFVSETDTEVIPQLIDFHLKKLPSFEAAFMAALKELRGAYAIAAITTSEPEKLYAARLSSPLVIGIAKEEFILASDPTALLQHTKNVIYLDDYDVAVLSRNGHTIHNLERGNLITRSTELLDFGAEESSLGGYDHFMLKEIHEAPATIRAATLGRIKPGNNLVKLGGLENVTAQLKYIDRIVIVACGTSYYAGMVGEYLIEELAGIPVEVQLASEFKYRDEPFSRSTALLAISQSGETADTIAALKKVEDYGCLRLGIVNAVGSTIARMTDAGVYCHAGPEQAVASTKAFIAQVTVLMLIALHLSNGRSKLYKPLLHELSALPDKVQAMLDQADTIKAIAKRFKNNRDFLFIGRRYAYPCALEGSLKLKELSYIHAEGYAGGELKHGPLAMIDKNFPTFAFALDSPLLEKTYSNIEEIKARKGPIIALATSGNNSIQKLTKDVIYVPPSPEATQTILSAVAIQLFAYYMAVELSHNVDRPRNLAKSVTVE